MVMTDPIADMLTRIRNANQERHETVNVPGSKMKIKIAEILKEEGFINDFTIEEDGVKKTIVITLKYNGNERVITGLRRISKPGLRSYCKSKNLPQVLGGMGIAVVSTSKGLLTDRKARKENLGGEVLCYVY